METTRRSLISLPLPAVAGFLTSAVRGLPVGQGCSQCP